MVESKLFAIFAAHIKNKKKMRTTRVMGIVNVTPDSFWAGSRLGIDTEAIGQRVEQILSEGGTMVDVGAYSTRPGAKEVTPEEEVARLKVALPVVHEAIGRYLSSHDTPLRAEDITVSVDTFRAEVARVAVTELGADMINDISGGTLDEAMLPLVARLQVPYILMHMRGTPQTMATMTDYPEGVAKEVGRFFSQQRQTLRELGHTAPVILDPGFGFAKTLQQNYELMAALPSLVADAPDCEMLVGISRKSMIYRLLDTDPAHALNGTTVLNTYAVLHGATILRVHDVRDAVEAVKITSCIDS